MYCFPYLFFLLSFLNLLICSLRYQVHDVKSGQSVISTKMCCLCTTEELTPCCCHTGVGAVASREEREEVERWALSQVVGIKVHFIIAKFWGVLPSQKLWWWAHCVPPVSLSKEMCKAKWLLLLCSISYSLHPVTWLGMDSHTGKWQKMPHICQVFKGIFP